jgi:SEC-C motif-containing protein
MELCPCGSNLAYSECCEPFITAKKNASTAEQLMRARYTAYAKQSIDYILTTTLEEKRSECDERAIQNWSSKSIWHQLEILSTKKGGPDDNEGLVEFIAHFTESGIRKNLHEKGVFKKVDGNWFYVDGEIQKPKPFTRTDTKISRNDPCTCGSGKKFKKCCGVGE